MECFTIITTIAFTHAGKLKNIADKHVKVAMPTVRNAKLNDLESYMNKKNS